MKKLIRQIIFTKVPLGGYYRFSDEFQIFPLELPEIPKSKFQKQFPNVIEFWDDQSINIVVPKEFESLREMMERVGRAGIIINRLIGLLTCFTNHRFFQIGDIEGSWGIPIFKDDIGDEINDQPPVWFMNMYPPKNYLDSFPKASFTEVKLEKIPQFNHHHYYYHDPNIDSDKKINITFPNTIDNLFASYFNLNEQNRNYIDTAVYDNSCAVELYRPLKTLSLVSTFTALETMVNLEFKDVPSEKCETCGQQMYSVRKKFRDYLLKYIGNSDGNKKKFNKYYDLRSKIIHTGQKLKSEHLFTEVESDDSTDEELLRMEILQLGRLSIIKWLLYSPQKASEIPA